MLKRLLLAALIAGAIATPCIAGDFPTLGSHARGPEARFPAAQGILIGPGATFPGEAGSLTLQSPDSGAAGPILECFGDSSSPAVSDVPCQQLFTGRDSATNREIYAKKTINITDPTSASEDATTAWGVITAGTLADEIVLDGASFAPFANDGNALGNTTTRWADGFFADGAVLNLGTTSSRATITHIAASDSITIAADPDAATASSLITLSVDNADEATLNSTNFSPGANDGNALGVSGTAWADLFLATGGLIEMDGGTTNSLTCTGGDCTIEGNRLFRVGGADVPVADGGTGASSLTDLITLTTHTSGVYVAQVADGTGIDGTANAEGATYTPSLDTTEVSSTTWGAGAFTAMTFDAGATDPTFTYGSASVAVTNVTTWTLTAALPVDTLISNDPGAVGSIYKCQHDSASPADGDIACDLQVFAGTDDEEVGRIAYELDDGATTTEDGQWRIFTDVAGTSAQQAAIGQGIIVGTGTTFPGAGNLGVQKVIAGSGTGTPVTIGQSSAFQAHSTGADSSSITISRWSADGSPSIFNFGKSRGTTVGTDFTVPIDGDDVGVIRWYAADSNTMEELGEIIGEIDGTVGDGDMPGRVSIRTSTDGTTSLSNRFVVKNDGGVIIGGGNVSPGAESLSIEGGIIEVGNAGTATTDTTITRPAAGRLQLEAVEITLAATQAEQETGTSTVKSPTSGNQHNHPSAAKVWGVTTGAGTPVIGATDGIGRYNMTSIADAGTGRLTVTIATDFSSAVYTCVTEHTTSGSAGASRFTSIHTKAAGSFESDTYTASTPTLADAITGNDWACFGDQ